MPVSTALQYMALLSVIWPDVGVTSSKVDQFPKHVNVARGANVSLFCTFPLFQDAPDVVWWRQGENKFLEPENRKQFNVKKGSGSFDVVNVSIEDTGMYYCKVKHQEKTIGDGAGSLITVYVPPTPLEIALIEGISSASLKLECKTAAFYPEHLGISWRRDGVDILTGIETVKNRTAKGLYEVSSFLEEVRPARSGVVYTCLVSHVSLVVPAGVSYTFKGTDSNLQSITLIFGCAGGALAIILLIILIRLGLKASNGVKRDSVEAGQREQPVRQGPTEEISSYATLNLRDDKGPTKGRHEKKNTVHSQTKQETEYAALNGTGTRKIAKPRQKEERTVYAQTKQGGRDNMLTYAALQLADSKKTSKSKHKDKCTEYAEVNVTRKEIR